MVIEQQQEEIAKLGIEVANLKEYLRAKDQ